MWTGGIYTVNSDTFNTAICEYVNNIIKYAGESSMNSVQGHCVCKHINSMAHSSSVQQTNAENQETCSVCQPQCLSVKYVAS